jgi:hypothetical protein
MIECLVCDHEHQGHRYACDDCVIKLQRRLREIGPYWDMLGCAMFHEPSREGLQRGAPGYASRSPARDDVVVALDSRSSGDIYGPDDVDEPIIGIAAGIHHMVTWVRELDPAPPARGSLGLGYLLVRVPHVAMTRQIGTLGHQIGRLYDQCRTLVHDRPPGPIAKCMSVGCSTGLVFAESRRDRPGRPAGARCDTCLRTYIGRDLWMLSVQQEAS